MSFHYGNQCFSRMVRWFSHLKTLECAAYLYLMLNFTVGSSKKVDLPNMELSAISFTNSVNNVFLNISSGDGGTGNDTMCGWIVFLNNSQETENTTLANNGYSYFGCDQKPSHAPRFVKSTLARVVTLSIIACISFAANSLTLTSIFRNYSKSRSTIYWLIAQLAIADLLVTVFCLLAEAVWTYTVQWIAGDLACKIIKFMQMFSLYLSTFLLVVIGFDRFTAVRFPMKKMHSKKKVKKLVIAVWILSGLFSIPQVVIFRVIRGPFVEEFYQCVTYGFYTEDWQEQLYTTVSLVLMFLLPLVILMFTYTCTFYTIAKKENNFDDREKSVMDNVRRKVLRKAKMKALMITVVIVMAFVICWTPYYCMMIIFIFLDPDEQLSEDLQAAIFFFGSSTAMINPLIYGAFHLRRRPRSSQIKNNSSGSSRGENTVMLITIRKSKIQGGPGRTPSGKEIEKQCNGKISRSLSGLARHPSVQSSQQCVATCRDAEENPIRSTTLP